MLQVQQHLFCAVFFTNDVLCRGHYDIILSSPFPSILKYFKMWGVDSSGIHLIEKKRCRLKSINHEQWDLMDLWVERY